MQLTYQHELGAGLRLSLRAGRPQPAVMGDAIPAPAGVTVDFSLTLSALVGAHPEVICDGAPISLLPASFVAEPETTRTFAYTSDGRRHWLAVFVRDPDNHLLLLGNPIYLNY